MKNERQHVSCTHTCKNKKKLHTYILVLRRLTVIERDIMYSPAVLRGQRSSTFVVILPLPPTPTRLATRYEGSPSSRLTSNFHQHFARTVANDGTSEWMSHTYYLLHYYLFPRPCPRFPNPRLPHSQCCVCTRNDPCLVGSWFSTPGYCTELISFTFARGTRTGG